MIRLSSFSPVFLFGMNACLLLCMLTQVRGHGYMKTPRSRNFVAYEDGQYWPLLEGNPDKEDCPHCLNLGGTLGQCGVTGERNYDFPKNALQGNMHTNIQSAYIEGQIITVDVVLTAHHRGHFTFKACPFDPNDHQTPPTQDCFDANPLEFVSDLLYSAPKDPDFPDRAMIAPSGWPDAVMDPTGVNGMLFTYRFQLPAGLSGDHILLQWHYLTANSCSHEGYDNYNWPEPSWKPTNMGLCGYIPPDGRGVPEQFWNCAEISITASGPTNPPTLSPPVAPVTAAPTVPPTAEPTPSPPTPTTPSPTFSGPQTKTIIGYYASWQWYDRSGLAKPSNMDFTKVDRVNFAFFQVDASGNIWGTDSWADPQVLYGPQNWSPQPGDEQHCSWTNPTSKTCSAHHTEEGLISLVHAAGAEIYPSLGGWTLSDAFVPMAADPVSRARFADKCVEMIQDYDFDGIDIDWEYPGYVDHSGTPDDRENYNLLLDELRSKLDALGQTTGRYYGLTAALPCGPSNIANIDVAHVSTVLDELNIMTYDFHGTWSAVTGVNSAMYYQGWGPQGFSVDDCVGNWLEGGGTRDQINIGLPFYGRSYGSASGLNQPFVGSGSHFAADDGIPQYFSIVAKLGSMTSVRHEETMTQYAYFNDGSGFVSYDNEQAICDKTEYVLDNDLNGFIIWELSGDLMPDLSTPLLDTVNDKLADPNMSCGEPGTPTTVPPVAPPTPTPPPVTGTCGNGNVGNGVCPDNSLCCSEWGWCGSSSDHCSEPPPTPPPPPTTPPVPTPPTPPVSGDNDDSRLIAYMGNWQSCPTAQQVAKYTHIVIAFAVSYTWSPGKNICSATCEIAEPPICENAPNPGLVSEWQAAGKKVILSFGGAGMGGSWSGDNNDCWEYCFGRETQVVNRLTQLVNNMGLDGIDIDYEYFYQDRLDAIHFLREVTVGMRSSLGPGAIVTHAPMEPDIVQGSAYFDLFVELASQIDFVMPQYYNGNTRPATDGFAGGAVSAEAHYTTIVNQIFGGDATKIIFGFCITGCIGSATGEQAAMVMDQVNDHYECNGGAYFWVAYDDVGGAWSHTVSPVVAQNAGCSGPPTTPAPTAPIPPTTPLPSPAPITPSPTSSPVTPAPQDPWTMCCPAGYTGLKAYGDCMSYYHCVGGVVTGGLYECASGTLFSEAIQNCIWENDANGCTITLPCGDAPTSLPTNPPTAAPTAAPVAPTALPTNPPTAKPTAAPVAPTALPTNPPTATPTAAPVAPTALPTNPPTAIPTAAPVSTAPVVSPTLLPTATPTDAPVAPTVPPTNPPTATPTAAPVAPTALPTDPPTATPTAAPVAPTALPTNPPTATPTAAPVAPTALPTNPPTATPVASPTPVPAPTPEAKCCPDGFSGLRAYDSCTKFFHCQNGVVYGGEPTACSPGTLFDNSAQNCLWDWQTECGGPDNCPSLAPTPTPPDNEEMCCPQGFTGLRPFDSCTKYFHCVNGVVTGSPLPCAAGTLFDEDMNNCNWESSVHCNYAHCPSTVQ